MHQSHLDNIARSLGITERVRFLGLANQAQWPAVYPGRAFLSCCPRSSRSYWWWTGIRVRHTGDRVGRAAVTT
jgi:hypothetical protein